MTMPNMQFDKSKWTKTTVGKVANISTGSANVEDAIDNGAFPLYDRSTEVKKSNRFIYDVKGAVIIPGEGAVFNPRFAQGKFDLHQRAYAIVPFTEVECTANARFLYYSILLQKDYFASVATGSTVKSLRHWMIEEFPILLPPLEEQKRIVEILGAYDDLIALNERRLKLLEEMAQRLYTEMFVTNAEPSWETTTLGDALRFIRGRSYKSSEMSVNEGVSFVNLNNLLPYGGYKRGEERRFIGKFKEEQLLKEGDTIMGVTDMTQERRLVGHVARIPRLKEPSVFSMDLIKIVSKDLKKCLSSYIYGTFIQENYARRCASYANGATVLHLRPESIAELPFTLPSVDIQEGYNQQIMPIYSVINSFAEQNVLLREARDKLLPKLLRGEG